MSTTEELTNRPLLIGIAGGSGSGKTYLSHRIAELSGPDKISVLSMDQYFRTENKATATEVNFDHPVHLDLDLMTHHVKELRSGKSVWVPRYDFGTMNQQPHAYLLEPRKVLIIEGLFVLSPPIVELFDLTCFLDVEPDQRLLGRLLRDAKERCEDVEGIVDRYQRFVRPSYNVFVAPTRLSADVVVDFTYRRAFFTHLLALLVTSVVQEQISVREFVESLRQEDYRLGYKPGESVMPGSVDIRRLAKAYPEQVLPTPEWLH